MVLRSCELVVERALRAAEAAEWLRVKQFHLAVMCHTLPETALQTLQIQCWRSRVPVYRLPVLATPEELIGAVTARVKTRI